MLAVPVNGSARPAALLRTGQKPGIVVALVSRLAWPRSAPGPLPDDAVLLADPGTQDAREVFLSASMTPAS